MEVELAAFLTSTLHENGNPVYGLIILSPVKDPQAFITV